jgi:exopolysaccharide biosynthesis polyprenyl glycosylphosphotransferase
VYIELLILDTAVVTLAFCMASWVRGASWLSPDGINLALLFVPIYLLMAFNRGAFSIEVLRSRGESIRRALAALLFTMLILLMVGFFVQAGEMVSRLAFASAVGFAAVLLVLERRFFCSYAERRAGGRLTDTLLIVDDVRVPAGNFHHVIDATAQHIVPDLRNPEMLARLALTLRNFDKVVVAAPVERHNAWSLLLKGSGLAGEIMVPDGNDIGAIGLGEYQGTDTLVVSRGPLSVMNRAKKRALDLAITVPLLIALAPLLVMVAIAIKLESRGPVFFRQLRVGRGNQPFEILKFRSMRVESCDTNGNRSTARDDDRITRVGGFIRKTSIDELPQLLNVLRSDMSLVGPRPHALGSLAGDALFWEVSERYWMRHALKPGITGLAQVRGFRGATHARKDLEDRLHADLEYINGWRLWRDVSILVGTAAVLIHPNAY